jgi:hypothetical protein
MTGLPLMGVLIVVAGLFLLFVPGIVAWKRRIGPKSLLPCSPDDLEEIFGLAGASDKLGHPRSREQQT